MADNQIKICCVFSFFLICVLMTCYCCQSMMKAPGKHIDLSYGKPETRLKPADLSCGKPKTEGAYAVYGYMACPYTVKQIDYMDKKNIPYTFVDTKTEAGSKALASITGGGSGVPVIVNTKNNEFKVGFTEL